MPSVACAMWGAAARLRLLRHVISIRGCPRFRGESSRRRVSGSRLQRPSLPALPQHVQGLAMLQRLATRAQRAVPPARAVRASSSSSVRPAAVAPNQPPTAAHRRPPPPPPHQPYARDSAQQKPQPFILRGHAESGYQIESVHAAPAVDPAAGSTTLAFVSPSAPDQRRTVTVPDLWLRDSSIHTDHVHPSSNQRLFRTSDIPLEGTLVGYGVHDLPGHGECLVTEWSKPLKGHAANPTTAKLSVVPTRNLLALLDNPQHPLDGELPPPRTWDRAALQKTLVRMPYDRFRSDDAALLETLDALVRDGIVFLTGVPTAEREGHHTELRKLVEHIGSLRRTWYGDLWDVKAVEGSLNIAYTNLDLGLHMDLT